ncbi:tenascin-X isoform X4 [Lissotriton helveticus]
MMASPALTVALLLAALQLGPASAGLFTKRFRLPRAAGANATFFSHVYNIRMPRCDSCAADVAVPTAALQEARGEMLQEARGETTQQQLYEHTLEGEQQMVFTHRINIPPQACGCPNADTMQRLLKRLEALEAQVATFRDQCPGGTCCAATQAGNGQTDIQGLCSQHGKFDFGKCLCVCEKGWGGPTCSESSCPDNCNDRGTCLDSECICHDGFTGESCEMTTCLDDCNDQGRCIGGKCVCFPGYTGPACGDQACPDNCRGHGKCIKESCVCDPGYTGPDCSAKACPDNCGGRGKCLIGSCVCEVGFGGPDCGTRTCPENCRNRGKCIDGICVCSPGYLGPDCGSRSCPENCKNRGQCINGKCICNPGFTGPACGARSCPENCHDHGQCINGKCLCNPGYSGPSCGSRICPDNCNRRGVCKDGSCICTQGFTGPNCGIRTCPENCQNRGRCQDGQCVCQAGYAGPNCGTKTCPDNCRNLGRCEDGRCVCDEGYAGANCGTKTCPDNCSNQGRCEDGTCVCETGFTGPNCGTKKCPDNCKNQGRCKDGRCACDEGFTGSNCGTKTCPDNCSNQGRCVDGTCICKTGFTGSNCGNKTCPDNCKNRGRCDNGRCVCDEGFAGSNCETKICPGNCSSLGLCVDGQCVCKAGYGGPNCGTRTCPNNCNSRGRCENGKCKCDKGYGGPICGLKLCPNNCNNQGRCLKGTCICRRGYTGPDCREVTCQNQCQGRGICVDGLCQCQAGYAGPDCSEKTCPNACSEKGRCEDGKCVCQDGFTGEDCSIEVPAVRDFRMRVRDETSVIMEWERPTIPVDGFEISFRPTKKDDGVLSSRLRSTVTTFNQSGLVPGEEYLVTIWTQKDQTLGPETTKTVTTRIDGPKNLKVTEVTQASITLHWDRPVATVDRYLVTYASEAGVARQLTVPAGRKEAVTLMELDSGTEYAVTVTAERGSESSMPASTTASTAAADGAGGPRQEPTVVGVADEKTAGYSQVVKKLSPSSPTPKVKVTDQAGGKSPEQRPQLTDGERIVTTVITGEERQKVLLLSRRPSTSEEELGVTKVIAEGERQKVKPPKTHSSMFKEERVITGVSTTQEPPKSSGPNLKPVVIKKGRVVTTVITRHKNVVQTNEKHLLTKEERVDTTPQTRGQLPHVPTSSGRPLVLREERVAKKVLTGEGTSPVVSTGRRSTGMKEEKVVTNAITRKELKKEVSVDDRSTLTTVERVPTTGFTEEVSPKGMSTKRPSVTREESVITTVLTREGAKNKLPTHGKLHTKDGKFVTTVITGDQFQKVMWPTKSPPPLTKKENIVTSVSGREGAKKIMLTDEISQVTKDTTRKDISPTKKPLIELSSITPSEESLEVVSSDKRIPYDKKVRVIAINITKTGHQTDLYSTTKPYVPKKNKVVLGTVTKEQPEKTVSSETKPEEREKTKVISEKQLPKVGHQDKMPSQISKDKVREILITGENSREVMLPEKRPTHSKDEKATISTVARKEQMPDVGKKPATNGNTEITRLKKVEDTYKVVSPTKKPGALKERVVTSTVTKQGTRKESSSDAKPTPKVRSLVPTAVTKVVDKKVPAAEKKHPFKKDGSMITKAVEKEKHQKVNEEVTVGRPTTLDKKGPGREIATASKIRMEFSNQTSSVGSRTKFLPTNDLMLETVIQNISAKLSPFNGTLLQRLESYLRATSYPLRENQTIKSVAKAIFLYLINKKPNSVREIVYDRLAEKTPPGVTMPLARPTLSSGRVKAQGTRVTPLVMPGGDSNSDGKPKVARRAGQQKHTTGGPPTMETRKEANTANNRLLKTTSVSQEESYRSRDALHVEQTALNRTTMDHKKHVRPQVVTRLPTSIVVSLDGLKGHSNSVVIYYKDIRADSTGHRLVFPGDANVAKISGLTPGATYRIDLHGVFKGQSSKSYSIVTSTSTAPEPTSKSTASDESPVGAPSTQTSPSNSMAGLPSVGTEPDFRSLGKLFVANITYDSFSLSWSADPGVYDHFVVRYKDSAATEPVEVLLSGDQRTATLSHLLPGTEYEIEVHGVVDGLRTMPLTTTATTAHRKPKEQPSLLGGLAITSIAEDGFGLTWKATKGVFDLFLVRYEDAGGQFGSQEISVPGAQRVTTIRGLDSATEYIVSVYGVRRGQLSRALKTKVTTAPLTPSLGDLSVLDATQDSIRLSWSVQDGDFDSFLLQYRDPQGRSEQMPVDAGLHEVTVSGLQPAETYMFELVGISTDKQSEPVSLVAKTALPEKTAPHLFNLSATEITRDSLQLSWNASAEDFDSFLIQYRDAEGKPQELAVDGDLRSATISGLRPSKKYTFSLHGVSGDRKGTEISTEVTTATAVKAQIQPRLGKLNISDILQDSLRLSWTVQGGDFDSFLILYRDAQGNTLELPIPGDLRIATISGLKPSKKYKFLLHGISASNRSKPVSAEATTAAQKKTVAKLPKVGDISISEVQKDSLVLSWAVSGGDFDSFVIQYKDSEGIPRQLEVDGHLRTTKVKGLKPSEKYKFVLYGVSENRRAQPVSAEAITAALEVPPTSSPWLGELTVSDVTKDSVRLSWTQQGGDYDTFLIFYRDADGRPQGLPVKKDQRTARVSGLTPTTKYTFLLYGVKGRRRSTPITAEATTGPDMVQAPKPTLANLAISEVTEDSLQLSWAVQGGDFDTFLIQYRDPEENPLEVEVDGNQHTTTISDLVPSKKYTFYLQGIIGTERVGPISTDAVTASLEKHRTRPARLGDLSISNITQDSLQLAWTIQDGDFDSFLIQYRDVDGKVQELPVDRELRSVTISGLRPSKKYKFILYGLTGDRRSKSISTDGTTVPFEKVTTRLPRLSDLSVSDITKDSLQLSWDVEDGVFGSFLIQYRDADGTPRVLTVDGDFRTARIVGLKPAKKYKFSIYGVSGDRRTKALATEAITAPPEKAITHSPRLGEFFVSDITKDSLQLAWTAEGGDFDSFVIQYRDTDGQTQEVVVDGDIHSTTITGLLPSRKYQFNLYGISRNKRTKPISTEATTAFPEAVGQQAAMLDDLYLSDVGPHTGQLSWEASEGAFDSFLIQYADSHGVAPKSEMVMAGNARTAMIEGLEPNTEYTFTLSGLHRGQKRANLSTVGRTSRLDLEPPRNLEFRNIKETSLMVTWTRPSMPIDTFKVSYQLADGGEPQSLSVDGKATKVPLKGLTPGARYEVNVMSIRGFEESEPLTGYVTTVPDGPTDLRAINVTETSALLLWRPALATIDTYVVTFSAHNVPEVTKIISGNTAELQLRGLNIDTEYTATIHSTKGSNHSSPAIATFTTSADAPRDLTASRVSPRSAVLSWTPPKAVPTGYILTYEAPSGETKEIQLEASANSYTLSELIPSSQYRARVQAMRGKVRTAPTSTMFNTARLRYPFPRDCAEERLNGAIRSQPMTIYLKGDRSHPIKVFCDMDTDGGGWMVFQRRMNGKTNFWRNWDEYAAGFGNLTQEFWLGNENLHKLTSQGAYELRVDLRTKNESAYAVYDSFRVDTQNNHYRLRLGKYSGTAGDSLSYHNNMIFSTRDRDRNKHIMPCSISYRGAWWYKNCHYVNLNGLYGNNKDHQGINWYNWKGFEFSIPFTEMKMRPKNSVALRRI